MKLLTFIIMLKLLYEVFVWYKPKGKALFKRLRLTIRYPDGTKETVPIHITEENMRYRISNTSGAYLDAENDKVWIHNPKKKTFRAKRYRLFDNRAVVRLKRKIPVKALLWLIVLILAALSIMKQSENQEGKYMVRKNDGYGCLYYQGCEYVNFSKEITE